MSCNGEAAKMRMVSSCNGCRVLRKRCSDHCTIRPCLEWISTPEAQGNATAFLAKFYGRAGLLNLIAAAAAGDDPDARPAVFRSLIYEACGRIVNPVFGAVGLLWSGEWHKCVDAVDAMFKGELGVEADAASSEAGAAPPPPFGARLGPSAAAYDIRHFNKDSAAAAADLPRFARAGRGRMGFKRAASSSSSSVNPNLRGKAKARGIARLLKAISSNNVRASPSPRLGQGQRQEAEELEPVVPMVMEELLEHDGGRDEEFAGSHDHHLKLKGSKENTDVEAASSQVIQEPKPSCQLAGEEVGLELKLGVEPAGQ